VPTEFTAATNTLIHVDEVFITRPEVTDVDVVKNGDAAVYVGVVVVAGIRVVAALHGPVEELPLSTYTL